MSLPAKAFQRWLQDIAPDTSAADVCRVSGIKRTTLAQQMVRGKVAASTVVAISRAYGVNPIAALSSFEVFHALARPCPPPSAEELVSQVSTTDLLRAVLARSATDPGGTPEEAPLLGPVPHSTSVKSWVDAIDDGELRHRVAAATGIAPQNYSAQLTANRLKAELAVATAEAAGTCPATGLVASGLVTELEAGWHPDARRAALNSVSDARLASLAGERLQALGRTLRRQEQVQEQTEMVWENLG